MVRSIFGVLEVVAVAVERVAVVEVAVARAAAEEQLVRAVEVDPAVADELVLAEDVVVAVGVVDGEVDGGQVRAVIDECAVTRRDGRVDEHARLALLPLELALEAFELRLLLRLLPRRRRRRARGSL